jgi:hypothetical protein
VRVATPEMKVPVDVLGARIGRVMPVLVAVTVEPLGRDHPQREQAHRN